MRFGRSRLTEEASFDLTPMIDVVLLLIVFFTLTSQFGQTQQAPMALPKEEGEDVRDVKAAALVIDMDVDGRLSVHGAEVTLTELASMVREEVAGVGEGLEVVVRAHRECSVIAFNHLAEALAGVGVREWKLATTGESG